MSHAKLFFALSRARPATLGLATFSKRAALFAILFGGFCVAASAPAVAQSWVATWAASPQAPQGMPATYSNQTLRQIVHVSIGGSKVRIRLSNEHGTRPVVIGAASVALAGTGADTASDGLRPLTFGGSKSVVLRPGAPLVSDSVDLTVHPLSNLAVSIYLPATSEIETVHQPALQTGYLSTAGDFTERSHFPATGTFNNRVLISGVMVETNLPARAVVAFGASQVNGNGSTVNANGRWTDVLARRLNEAGMPVAVVNAGIAGNRLLTDRIGVNGLARFDRDVLSQPGLSHVIVLLGTNDLGMPGTPFEPNGVVPQVEDMAAGYKQLIERAHIRGIKVLGATLPPFENALAGTPNEGYFSPEKEARRQAVNAWIRSSGAFDGVIDFDRVVANPARPIAIAQAYDSGDHLHPNDAGYKAMADSIDAKLLE